MNETTILAAAAAGELLVILALLWMLHRARVESIRSIDRLLLLGKSTTPGEAIAAYERLNRIESIRGAISELRAQRDRGDVARKETRGPNWFGFRRRRPTPATGG